MAIHKSFFLFTVLALCMPLCSSREFQVGGQESGWKIPSSPEESLNEWAEDNRFNIGDILVLKYNKKNDSVLEVTKKEYEGCMTSKPIKEYNDGETHIKLERTGPYYLISGAKGHCEKGQKLEVVVLSKRDHQEGSQSSLAPAMSPALGDTEASSPETVLAPQKSGVNDILRAELLEVIGFGLAGLLLGLELELF